MKKRRNNDIKNVIIAIIFLLIVFMTAGYATYSRDLVINGEAKIYSDWDVRFTDINLDHENSTLLDDEQGGANEGNAPVIADDGLSITIDVGFVYFTDQVVYEIEITNFSEIWDAKYVGVIYSTSLDDYILYEVSDIEINDLILADSTAGANPNTKTVTLRAYWNPTKGRPSGTTEEYETTYTETATITLVFEASK